MTILNGADNIQSLKIKIEMLKSVVIANVQLLAEENEITPDKLFSYKADINRAILDMINTKVDIEYIERGWK